MARVFEVTPVLDTNIYADNDVFFVPVEVVGAFKNGVAKLVSVVATDDDDQDIDFDLVFTNANITLGTINAAVSVSDTDADKIVGYVRLVASTDSNDLINSWVYSKGDINQIMAKGSTDSLWVSGIVRSATPTYTASGLKLKLGFE